MSKNPPTICGSQTRVPGGALYENVHYQYENSRCVLNTPVSAATVGSCAASSDFFDTIVKVCFDNTMCFGPSAPDMITLSCNIDASFQPEILIREVIEMLGELEQSKIGLHKISCNSGVACMPDTLLKTNNPFKGHLRRQISVTMSRKSPEDGRSCDVKLFCTGNVQIPGCIKENVGDGIDALDRLLEVMQVVMKRPRIDVMRLRTIMRNYKFNLINESLMVDLPFLHNVLTKEMNNDKYKDMFINLMTPEIPDEYEDRAKYSEYHLKNAQQTVIDRYLHMTAKFGPMTILNVTYDPQRTSGLMVRVCSCRPPRQNKGYIPWGKVTIQIFGSGKVNIKAANTPEESSEIYSWLSMLFQQSGVIVDKTKIPFIEPLLELYPISDDEKE